MSKPDKEPPRETVEDIKTRIRGTLSVRERDGFTTNKSQLSAEVGGLHETYRAAFYEMMGSGELKVRRGRNGAHLIRLSP